MFLDLHKTVLEYKGKIISSRATKLAIDHPGAHIVGIGGFPIRRRGTIGPLFWAGQQLYNPTSQLRELIKAGLGLSAVPTYMNKSNKSIWELGRMCAEKKHLWAYKWMTVSILLCCYGQEAELAFARDTNFYLSWPVETRPGLAFVVNGSISAWLKFTNRGEDVSFHPDARKAMNESSTILKEILPTGE